MPRGRAAFCFTNVLLRAVWPKARMQLGENSLSSGSDLSMEEEPRIGRAAPAAL
jgi:hypothetical protein